MYYPNRIILHFVVCIPLVTFSQNKKATFDQLEEAKLHLSSNPQKAIALLEQALKLAQTTNDESLYLESLSMLSTIDYTNHEDAYNKTVAWMKEAIRLKSKNPSISISDAYYFIGIYYSDYTTEIDSAIYNINKALQLRLKLIGEQSESVAQCYHALGDIYKYTIFDFLQAEMNYEKSLQIRERNKSINTLTLATNYYNLATTNRSQRDFEKALSYGMQAITISRELQNLTMLEMSYTMTGNILRDMRESMEAIQLYKKAIALNTSSHNIPELFAWAYIGMGETYKNDSLWDQALLNLGRADAIYKQNEKKLAERHKQLWVYCQLQLAETYLLQKEYGQAHRMIRTHHATLKRLNMAKGRLLAESYTLSGNYYLNIQKNDSALLFFQRALSASLPDFTQSDITLNPTEKEINTQYYVYRILQQKARGFEQLYHDHNQKQNLKHAIHCLVLAEKLLVLERSTLDVEESRWRFSNDNFDIYEHLISLLYERHKSESTDSIHALIFQYFEKSKARTLNDILTHGEQQKAIDKSDTLLLRQNELKQTRFSLQHQLAQEQEIKIASSRISVLQQKLVEIDRSLQHNKTLIEFKYPGYFKIKYNQEIPNLSSLQQALEKESIVIEFFFGSANVYALAIDQNTVLFKKIGDTDQLEQQMIQLIHHFSDNHSSLNLANFHSFSKITHQLYNTLLVPFQPLLNGKKKIHIIPDGLINQIPFEILTVEISNSSRINYKALKYAIHEYNFGYAYSASVLKNKNQQVRNPTLLAMGFTGGQQLRSASSDDLSDIDGALLELNELKTQFQYGRFLLGNDVSESNFKRLAPNYDIIHLAVHGIGSPDDQYASSLFFRNQADSIEDGELHSYELFGLNLKTRLAVLTACESGLGKAYKGEGMMSIASAFSYAGCQNVLLSLWKVNDQESVGLMADFYKQLLSGHPVDEALKLAKISYLEQADELTADPKIWAPLVAYGDLHPIVNKRRSSVTLLIFGIGAMILLLIFVKIRKKRKWL